MKRIAALGAALTVIGIVLAVSPASGQLKPSVRPVQPAVTQAVPAVPPTAEVTAPSTAPPPVRTQWGDGRSPPPSVADKIGTKYRMFTQDGPSRPSIEGATAEKNRPAPAPENEDEEDDETP